MKKIIFSSLIILLAINGNAQEVKYKDLWKSVEKFEKEGKPQTALKEVDKIYLKAKKENNFPEFFKSVLYQISLLNEFEENSLEKSILKIDNEIPLVKEPNVQILHSAKAQMLWSYYKRNRYKFLERTSTINYDKADISTWDLRAIVKEVFKEYLLSLKNPNLLKKTSLNNYEQILTKAPESRKFRPTLYDFLAHRAVDFFMGEEPQITKPSNTFYIDNANFLGVSEIFAKTQFSTPDSLSMKFYALKLLQDLVEFHLNDINSTPKIDLELKRLKFVKKNAIFAYADSLYLKALLELYENNIKSEYSTDIAYEIGNEYIKYAEQYEPEKKPEYQYEYNKAIKILNQAINNHPKSTGANNCKYLVQKIENTTLTAINEDYIVPDKPFRTLINYRNTNKVFVRILKIASSDYQKWVAKYEQKKLIEHLVNLSPFKQLSFDLPNDNDYQNNSVEVNLPALPVGFYIILTSNSEKFDLNNDIFSYNDFQTTNLTYITRYLTNGNIEVVVYNREKGFVIQKAEVVAKISRYNYTKREYEDITIEKGKTDAEGRFFIKGISQEEYSRSLTLLIQQDKDEIISRNSIYQYRPDTNQLVYSKTYFFTDRAIYRPGQTIYFKGITIDVRGDKGIVAEGRKTEVRFLDANWQEISKQTFRTNEYGSFSGTFIAPVGLLNGQMQITNNNGNAYFSVEEYKRPKFEVKFEPIKGSYKLKENVLVKGIAKAYAGNAIDGANVKYRVVRKVSYPWWRWWWGYSPSKPDMEILNGETKTNENGEFTINFNAIPDYSIKKELYPMFNYSIFVDVSDINGETHPANTSVSVAYISMLGTTNISDIEKQDKIRKFDIRTTNLNGQLEPAIVDVKIYKLKQPEQIFNTRYWTKPSKFIINKTDYNNLFPYECYKDEIDKNKWEKEIMVYDKKHNTATDTILDISQAINWNEGQYIIEINGKDKYGEAFEFSKLFNLTDFKSNICSQYEHLLIKTAQYKYQPNDVAKIAIETKHKNSKILFEVEKNGSVIERKWLNLDDNKQIIDYLITPQHYGELNFHVALIINNRAYSKRTTIYVPKEEKNLNISFETFRDKLQPGQEEEWRIKIKGEKGEKIASELLTSMYDASLDAFVKHFWSFYINYQDEKSLIWNTNTLYNYSYANNYLKDKKWLYPTSRYYENLSWFGLYLFESDNYYRYSKNGSGKTRSMAKKSDGNVKSGEFEEDVVFNIVENSPISLDKDEGIQDSFKSPGQTISKEKSTSPPAVDKSIVDGSNESVQVRTNFNETAFFMPQLTTDAEGNIVVKFKIPESLTRWKVMGVAHTKDLKIGQFSKELVTQKELMVVPNQPRFFRENDKMDFAIKISNISEKDLTGIAKIEFFDGLTMKPINSMLGLTNNQTTFSTLKGQSTSLSWNISIPQGLMAITYRVTAKSENFSDGEEMTLPVLTNRMLVTESMPLPINGNQTKKFTLEKLKKNTSTTLTNFKYTLEFTSNPAWYAIQALPYLIEYPYECSEQVFSRFYANTIATHIANSSPKIKAVFESWKINSKEALMSNLEKNQELKYLMLEETPWVLDAQNENEQKKRIGLLFDIITMSNNLNNALEKLEKLQTSNGGWPWFKGMRDNEYITQYIVTGFGHLKQLGITSLIENKRYSKMIEKAVIYLDYRIKEEYDNLKKWKVDLSKNHLSYYAIQYLYARTYFIKDIEISSKNQEAYNYYLNQTKKYWLNYGIYMNGMLALINYRADDKNTADKIMASVKDKALYSEEMGMYWKSNYGYYWHEAPIEQQALLIEAFDIVSNDKESVEKMKIWLLKQKQTTNWKTTKATAEACYALLLRGTNQLLDDKLVEIKIGDKIIDPSKMDNVKVEAGTGYFKTSWKGDEIKKDMAEITVNKTTEGVAWGSVYWQYFENLDKITPAATPLSLKKEVFVVRQTPTGDVIEPIKNDAKIKVGDKIKIRIELRSDRDMEFVHMKDMRAAAFEPVNVISTYKYQDGLGYYESTRDAATNFFFDYLRKGTYVFEYTLYATQKGNFSNGITTIQCMYAPEFTSHSEGIRVNVE